MESIRSAAAGRVTEAHFGIHEAALGAALDRVILRVAERYGFGPDDLRSRSRRQPLARVRQLAYFVAREVTAATTPEIAHAFNRADHVTVLYGLKQANDFIARNPDDKTIVHGLITELRA